MNLQVKLRDGFRNDTVTIRADGREVYHRSGVSTDLTISHADSVSIPVQDSTVRLEVSVQDGPSEEKDIRVRETPFVDVWILDGTMELRASAEETPML